MHFKRKRIGKGYLRYKTPDEVPSRLGIARQKITDLGHTTDRGLLDRWAVLRRYAKPLRRFLKRQVGRPWVEVQAELDVRLAALHAPKAVVQALRRELCEGVEGFRVGIDDQILADPTTERLVWAGR